MTNRLLMCRHAESEFNVTGIVNGDPTVRCALSERGREQARALGEELRSRRLDLCVTSEFERATQTAEIALAGRGVPVTVLPELNDPRLGVLEQTPLTGYLEWLRANDARARPEGGGESQIAVVERYCGAFELLLARDEAEVIVICHALPVAVALTIATPHGRALRREYHPVDQARIYELDVRSLRAGVERARDELSSAGPNPPARGARFT
jgi:broad specificity phosphatase PhoE